MEHSLSMIRRFGGQCPQRLCALSHTVNIGQAHELYLGAGIVLRTLNAPPARPVGHSRGVRARVHDEHLAGGLACAQSGRNGAAVEVARGGECGQQLLVLVGAPAEPAHFGLGAARYHGAIAAVPANKYNKLVTL